MTSNPAFTERNIQRNNAYLLDSRPEQKSFVTYHTLRSLYVCMCFCLVNTLTSTAPIGSPIICIWSPSDICEQRERNLSFGSADVRGTGTLDEPLRTSVWRLSGAESQLWRAKYRNFQPSVSDETVKTGWKCLRTIQKLNNGTIFSCLLLWQLIFVYNLNLWVKSITKMHDSKDRTVAFTL